MNRWTILFETDTPPETVVHNLDFLNVEVLAVNYQRVVESE